MPLLAPVSAPTTTPPPVRPPQAPRFQRLRMWWTGWDGSVWEITDPRSGAFLTQAGVEGLEAPPLEPITTQSPMRDGAQYWGENVNVRECFWPLYIYSDQSSEEWLARDRAFWRTLRRGKVGTWTVQTPDGHRRSLDCQFVEVDPAVERDPVKFGWRLYGIRLNAYRPYWLGETVKRTFSNEPPVPFYASEHDEPDPGALFYISSGSTLADAEITNPGEVGTAPLVQLDGPLGAGASVGIGSDLTTWAPAIADGKSVVIDTRPDHLTANLIDTPALEPGSDDWWRMVDGLDPIGDYTSLSSVAYDVDLPAEEATPLAISATGQGAVHVLIRGLHEKAY